MSFSQNTLRSFVNSDGKLLLCNESFFSHFGCSTEHLIGKSVADVIAPGSDVLEVIRECQSCPGECFTVETAKQCKEGCTIFRWEIYAEQQQGKVTGIHLVGNCIRSEKAAWYLLAYPYRIY